MPNIHFLHAIKILKKHKAAEKPLLCASKNRIDIFGHMNDNATNEKERNGNRSGRYGLQRYIAYKKFGFADINDQNGF